MSHLMGFWYSVPTESLTGAHPVMQQLLFKLQQPLFELRQTLFELQQPLFELQ